MYDLQICVTYTRNPMEVSHMNPTHVLTPSFSSILQGQQREACAFRQVVGS